MKKKKKKKRNYCSFYINRDTIPTKQRDVVFLIFQPYIVMDLDWRNTIFFIKVLRF